MNADRRASGFRSVSLPCLLALAVLLALAAPSVPVAAEDGQPLLRFPDIHGDRSSSSTARTCGRSRSRAAPPGG